MSFNFNKRPAPEFHSFEPTIPVMIFLQIRNEKTLENHMVPPTSLIITAMVDEQVFKVSSYSVITI